MSPNKRLVVGQGQISGYISIFLAVLALLGILCFHYPEKLTTPEFREIYTKNSMEALMLGGVIGCFFFSLLSLILSKKLKWAWPGFALGALAVILGALSCLLYTSDAADE